MTTSKAEALAVCGRCNKRLADSERIWDCNWDSSEDSYAVYDMREVDFEMDGFYHYYFVRPGWCQRCADDEFIRWERRYFREREARLDAEERAWKLLAQEAARLAEETRQLARKQLADEQEYESEPYPDNFDRAKELPQRARNRRR